MNTGATIPGNLHFGVSDGGYSDNTGAYTIKVSQLTKAPAPSALVTMAAGFAAGMGLASNRRRRQGRA